MRISDWSSDVCSSDLQPPIAREGGDGIERQRGEIGLSRHRHRPLGRRAARVRQAWGGVGSVCGGVQIRSLFGKSRKSDFQSRTGPLKSEENTSELQPLMRTSYAVVGVTKNNTTTTNKRLRR